MRPDLPSGTVTFVFTDVEGSTRLLHELGAEAYAEALAEHRRVIREACACYDGIEVDTQGDAFFFAFSTAPGALAAAGEIPKHSAKRYGNRPSSGRLRLAFHMLRHTAISLMCRAGYRPEWVAERVGHTDGGALILKRYRHLYPSENYAAAPSLDALVAER